MPAAKTEDKTTSTDTAKYVVVGAGVCYAVGGDPAHIELGLQNRVIDLVDSEAERLLLLGAIRAADDDEVKADAERAQRLAQEAAEDALGPLNNPYGGSLQAGHTLEEHAAEQIKLAKSRSK